MSNLLCTFQVIFVFFIYFFSVDELKKEFHMCRVSALLLRFAVPGDS